MIDLHFFSLFYVNMPFWEAKFFLLDYNILKRLDLFVSKIYSDLFLLIYVFSQYIYFVDRSINSIFL